MSLDTLISHNLLSADAPATSTEGCALVLMGGGARTAYQAGVLKALAVMHSHWATERREAHQAFPFHWLFGTSAGALNAAYLASRADQGTQALIDLAAFWGGLRSERVYRLEAPRWVRANRIVAGLTLARQVRRHRALLDTLPLVDTLHQAIDLQGLERALAERHLEVLGATASSYTTGEHWTFCQTRPLHPVPRITGYLRVPKHQPPGRVISVSAAPPDIFAFQKAKGSETTPQPPVPSHFHSRIFGD